MVKLPWCVSSTVNKWFSLSLLSICATFAFGPTMSNQTLQPARLDTGWGRCGLTNYGDSTEAGDHLNVINLWANGLGMFVSLFAGLYVSSVGPKILGLIGAAAAILGYASMAMAMYMPCSFGIGMWGQVLVNCAGGFYMYGPLCYLYALPEHGFTVSAIFNIAFVLADVYGSSASLMSPSSVTRADLSLLIDDSKQRSARAFVGQFYMLMAIGTTVFSFLGCWLLVPEKAVIDVLQREAEALQGQGGGSDEASGDDALRSKGGGAENLLEAKHEAVAREAHEEAAAGAKGPSVEVDKVGWPWEGQQRERLLDAWVVVRRLIGWEGVLLLLHIFAIFMLQITYQLEMYQYYRGLFGTSKTDPEARAKRLVEIFAILYEAVGIPACILFGVVADRFGPVHAMIVADLVAFGFLLTSVVPTFGAQIACQCFFTLVANIFYLLGPALLQRYSPPALFGTMLGIVYAVYGVVQVGLVTLQSTVLKLALPDTPGDPSPVRWRVVTALLVWCVLTVVIAGSNYAIWQRVRPPRLGSVTMAHVREARAFGGVGKAP